MTNNNQVTHKTRREIRNRLTRGQDVHDVIDHFQACGANRVLVENEVFKFNIRQQNPLLSLFLQFSLVYLTALSVFFLTYLIFNDLNKTALALAGFGIIVLFSLSFISWYKAEKSEALVIRFILLGYLLAAAFSLLLSDSWQLSDRPRHPFGVLFWAFAFIPVWIGPKIIGALSIVFIHLAVLRLSSNHLQLQLLKEANRQTKNFEVMLISQISPLKHVGLETAKRVVPAIADWLKSSVGTVGQFPINDECILVVFFNKEGLQLRCLKDHSESAFCGGDIEEVEARWAVNIPKTPYFY